MGNCTTADTNDPPASNPRNGVQHSSPPGHGSQAQAPPAPDAILPPGWQRKFHAESNRYYYVDHNEKKTHWNLPEPILQWQRQQQAASARAATQAVSRPSNLPPGWEMQRDRFGRTYYVDHNTRQTSWTPPPPPSGITGDGAFMYSLQNPQGKHWVRGFDGTGQLDGQRWLAQGSLVVPKDHPNPQSERGQIEIAVHTSLPMGVDWVRRRDGPDHHHSKVWYVRGDDLDAVKDFGGKPTAEIQRLPFKEKCRWFRQQMERLRVPWNEGHADLKLRRTNFTSDSFNIVEKLDQRGLRSNFRFEIEGETKLSDDAGGVTREWFSIMTREVFDPNKGLFKRGQAHDFVYEINEISDLVCAHDKNWFHFTGRMMAKALFDGMALSAHLDRTLYMNLLRAQVTLEDIEHVDKGTYDSMLWMKNNSIEDIMFETFSITQDRLGKEVEIDLIPDGRNKDVTDENKEEFIRSKVQYMAYDSKKEQINKFLAGFWEVIPVELLRVFTCSELEQVMCGTPKIDLADWQSHTFYNGEFAPSHPVVQWFWEVVESMDDSDQAKVLQFITASSVVPVEGFKGLQGSRGDACPFTIENVEYNGDGSSLQLPKAHTCFNKLDLPKYPSKKILEGSLKCAIDVECEGFYHE